MLFALNSSRAFAEKVARSLEIELRPHEEREFEDGEHKSRRFGRSARCADAIPGIAARNFPDYMTRSNPQTPTPPPSFLRPAQNDR